jgi:hypothetical protein
MDAVLLEPNDGRVHLEQVLTVLRAREPVFVDKPLAGSLAEVIRILDAAREAGRGGGLPSPLGEARMAT